MESGVKATCTPPLGSTPIDGCDVGCSMWGSGTMKKLPGIKNASQEMLQKMYHPEAVKQEKTKAEYEAKAAAELKELKAEKTADAADEDTIG